MPAGSHGRNRWTPEQELAISLWGTNVLVSAAAGAGKTSVLVERIIRRALSPDSPVSLDRMLVVTFTDKAASEMRQRIRDVLEKKLAESGGDERIEKQLLLLDSAQISTIDSFCLRIVRQFFYKVHLDPAFRVLDESEAELLRLEALEQLFEDMYSSEDETGERFRQLVDRYGGPRLDEGLKDVLLGLHAFARTQPSMEEWLEHARTTIKTGYASGFSLDNPWVRSLAEDALRRISVAASLLEQAISICASPEGPAKYRAALEKDLEMCHARMEDVRKFLLGQLQDLRKAFAVRFATLPRVETGSPAMRAMKEQVSALRDRAKEIMSQLKSSPLMRPDSVLQAEYEMTGPYIECLIDLCLKLDERFSEKKRLAGGVDFSDIERFALEILEKDGGLVASELKKDIDCVLVDEHQDTNPLQERILQAVCRTGDEPGNMFVVGDIKQSIYRFRLAEPGLFLQRMRSYRRVSEVLSETGPDRLPHAGVPGVRIDLRENFRSRKEIIDAVNAVFSRIMTPEDGEIDYSDGHELVSGVFGDSEKDDRYLPELHLVERMSDGLPDRLSDSTGQEPGEPAQLSESAESGQPSAKDPASAQESSDVAEDGGNEGSEDGGGAAGDDFEYEALEKEALIIAQKIRQLVAGPDGLPVRDPVTGAWRPCQYRDIAVLLRSVRGRANLVLDIFRRCGIPAYCDAGTGFFQQHEVEVALSLLSLLDNPLQDIPLAAVLRSPIVGLTAADLALIRCTVRQASFHDAVREFSRAERFASGPQAGPTGTMPGASFFPDASDQEQRTQERIEAVREKVSIFMDNLERWRTLVRRRPLGEALWSILSETGYLDFVAGLPGGPERQANLRALCDRARQFDKFGYRGLHRFLRFVEKLKESEGDLGGARSLGENEDVVRVMSVHKAKGLEFPVVFVADLGRTFNDDDKRRDILFHRELGIGAMCCDLDERIKYPSLAHAAISSRLLRESRAEEMRILYVAMTRARDKLILVGSARNLVRERDKWLLWGRSPAGMGAGTGARTYLDWVCPWAICGQPRVFDVRFWGVPEGDAIPVPDGPEKMACDPVLEAARKLQPPPPGDPDLFREVKRRLEWAYPLAAATVTPAKMSVGQLERRLGIFDEEASFALVQPPPAGEGLENSRDRMSQVERGVAVHKILACLDLTSEYDLEGLMGEVARLEDRGLIRRGVVGQEDVSRVHAFLTSATGKWLKEHARDVLREVSFTYALPARLLAQGKPVAESDFVVVQGIIDALVDEEDGLTIIDYKTDRIGPGQVGFVTQRYSAQVSVYALAAREIAGKPIKRAVIVYLWPGLEREVDWQKYLESRGYIAEELTHP